jgi:hypothetical protein
MHGSGQERREEKPSDANGAANQCHRYGSLANEPGIGDYHRRIHEAGMERKRNDPHVDEQQSEVAVHAGEQQVTCACHQDRQHHQRSGTVTIHEVPCDRTFERALRARQRKHQ